MKIYHSLDDFGPVHHPVVTIGSFDGMHLGHRQLISRIVELAAKVGGESVLLTFFPHPRMVLQPEEHGIELLTTTTEKINLLEHTGINHLVIHPFSRDFSELSPDEFIQTVLVEKLKTKYLVIGYDHRFGNNRSGSISDLLKKGNEYNFLVEEIPEQDVNDIAVSSSRIRKALKTGDVRAARELLGRPYALSGIVVRGNRIGNTIGFPTANIHIPESYKLIPAEGVYLCEVLADGSKHFGMMSIGRRPTLETKGGISVEVHIIDFNSDIYGSTITVSILDFIRNNTKFDSLEALKSRLQQDQLFVRDFIKSVK